MRNRFTYPSTTVNRGEQHRRRLALIATRHLRRTPPPPAKQINWLDVFLAACITAIIIAATIRLIALL